MVAGLPFLAINRNIGLDDMVQPSIALASGPAALLFQCFRSFCDASQRQW
jgi:hypothetical protein